jgi:hypothetical protein
MGYDFGNESSSIPFDALFINERGETKVEATVPHTGQLILLKYIPHPSIKGKPKELWIIYMLGVDFFFAQILESELQAKTKHKRILRDLDRVLQNEESVSIDVGILFGRLK